MSDETGCLLSVVGIFVWLFILGFVVGIIQLIAALTSTDILFMAGFFIVCAVLAIALHIVGKIYEK